MAIQDEDFDLDEILLIDDEYIYQASEDGTEPVQPAGKTCFYEGFLQTTRLSQVIGRTLRTIYAISKSKISRGFVGRKWDALVVADIDKSLNKWLEGVPPCLRYNPNEPDVEMLLQSSRVFVQYYYTQTLIHRPFIQSEKMNNTDLTFKSLAIVSNAARSAIHIMHNLVGRGLVINANPDICFRSFGFGCMLLFISWSAFTNNLRVSQSLMGDVRKVLEIFHAMQRRYDVARNMALMLQIIIKRSEVPILNSSLRQASKRGLEEERLPTANDGGMPISTSQVQKGCATAVNEAAVRDIRALPPTTTQLPLSTSELQSAFGNSDSPDSSNADIPSTAQHPSFSQPSYSSLQGTARQGDRSTRLGDWNSSVAPMNQEQWSYEQQQQQQQTSAQPFLNNQSSSFGPTFNNPIDSTIFDPTNRTLDAFLSGRLPNNSFDMFNSTPGGNNSLFGNANVELPNGGDGLGTIESQGMNPNTPGDPLDALVNMQSLWSDAGEFTRIRTCR